MGSRLMISALLLAGKMAAQLPETDIYLAKIDIKNNLIKFEKAENITSRKGYDNQPVFLFNKNILYSADGADGKVHICDYDGKKSTQLTKTNTSEYSPIALYQQKLLSCVVVEEDSSQHIGLYDLETGVRKETFTLKPDSVGYYDWLGKDSILYYKLTDPHSLRVLNLKTGEDNWLCDHPTRSFKQIDGRTIFYVIHNEKENLIYFYDIRVKKATLYASDKPDNQDYVWLPQFGMVKSEGPKLYRYSPETKVWVEAADFSASGITKITRFTFSPNKKYLALVSNQ